MSEGHAVWDCASDLLLSFSRSSLVQGEQLQVHPGLLALSSVCGLVTGVLTAALLLRFCVRPVLLTRQGYSIRRLLEPEDVDLENSPNEGVSSAKNEVPRASNKDNPEKKPPLVSGDVAAFATRAKVVYPINQKYRPLADGSSNPSLHEVTQVPPFSADRPSPSSSSCFEEDSEEEDEDCEGHNGDGRFVSSALPPSLKNHSFTPVSTCALTLTLTGVESRMNLYFLALRDVQQNYVQLQEEKDLVYFQIMKILFGARFPKNKQESDFCKMILQNQEKELSELKKQFPVSAYAAEETEGAVVTLEEIERSQKELLEHGLHTCKGFSKQLENLSQLLFRESSVHPEEAQEIIRSITKNLLHLEDRLKTCQDSLLTRVHEKVVWWEELTALLQTQPALLRKETWLRQCLMSTALEQMTSDGVLPFSQMEKVLSEIHQAQSDGLRQYHQDCVKKTSELVTEKTSRLESKRRKMLKNQSKERRVLEQAQRDLQGALKCQEELALRHQQELKDLETQQELRLMGAITDLWTSLRCSWSECLADQCRSLLLSSFSSESSFTQDQAQGLWSDLETTLGPQLHEAETSMRDQLQETKDRLDREGQMWREQMVLVDLCLKHLSDLQMRRLQELELRQSYSLQNQTGLLLALKHLHLLGALRRLFVFRHVSLNLLMEMRLSKLSTVSENDSRSTPNGERSHDMMMERRLTEEYHLLEQSLKQEFLSELETGAELLQHHLQTIMGNALSHSIQQEMAREHPALSSDSQDYNMKCRLTEAASESVYLTKDSLTALVQKYYSQLQSITGQVQQEPARLSDDEEKPEQSSSQIVQSVLRELQNWSRKPRSAEFQQRVELHKRRLLVQTDREQHRLWEELRHRRITQDIALDKVKDQLMEAEERFIEELAALARVSLPKEEMEPKDVQEDYICDLSVNIRELLALNPALDPTLNPSLTPLISAPVKIVLRDQKKKTGTWTVGGGRE